MQLVNIHEAKTHLSKLLEQVQAGEDVVIAKSGAPIVRLIPFAPPKRCIASPGMMEGEGWIADDFDAPIDGLFDSLKGHAE
ncbi:MAG: type II toxin-antitoxin system Phd/YefM family antitoxin [Sideroxydans sp.]|nr:type II toxin-antitoxin system Phd/YefM family antitoxin [Sideroxydans sp.]